MLQLNIKYISIMTGTISIITGTMKVKEEKLLDDLYMPWIVLENRGSFLNVHC